MGGKPMVTTTRLEWEVFEDKEAPGQWRVEAIGDDGECYVTAFAGVYAEERARNYLDWLTDAPAQ